MKHEGHAADQGVIMKGKIFTATEATRMLPLVRRIVTDAKACSKLIERHERASLELRLRLEAETEGSPDALVAELREHEQKIAALRERRETCRKELEELGAFLDDAFAGIVKFYGEMDSRIVYFTWKLGEDSVSYWHETDDEHSDRLPLDGDEKVANNAEF